jgi:hypothetical protein
MNNFDVLSFLYEVGVAQEIGIDAQTVYTALGNLAVEQSGDDGDLVVETSMASLEFLVGPRAAGKLDGLLRILRERELIVSVIRRGSELAVEILPIYCPRLQASVVPFRLRCHWPVYRGPGIASQKERGDA